MAEPETTEGGFQLFIPFVIDGDAYSDRDRAMFVAGYEFCQIRTFLEVNPGEPLAKPVHPENADRLRVLCGRFGRICEIEPIDGTWSWLDIAPA
jgi:hypothetical protein